MPDPVSGESDLSGLPKGEPTPEKDLQYWMSAYKGLQPKHQTAVEANKQLAERIAALEAELVQTRGAKEATQTTLQAQVSQLEAQLSGKTSELTELQTARDRLTRDMAKLQLVVKDFPELGKLDLASLPDGADADDLRARLGAFRDTLKSQAEVIADEIVRQRMAGNTPSGSPGANTAEPAFKDVHELRRAIDKAPDEATRARLFGIYREMAERSTE